MPPKKQQKTDAEAQATEEVTATADADKASAEKAAAEQAAAEKAATEKAAEEKAAAEKAAADKAAAEEAAAKQAAADKAAAEKAAAVITVQAKSEPYRRANIAWSTQPRTVALAELSEEQLAILQADPNLIFTGAE